MNTARALSRRKIFKGAIGAAAAGVGAGTVLTEVHASPALAATATAAMSKAKAERAVAAAQQATTVLPAAMAPAVVGLADTATIAVDASRGNDFRVTIAGNRTMSNPSNPAPGQQIIFQITQGSGGPYTITWDSDYEFSGGLPEPVLSASPGQTDLLGFIYNAARARWLLAAFVNGFG
jgi:hypothetical protein